MTPLAELIRNTQDRTLTPVPTPEWGQANGQLFVRRMSPVERHAMWARYNELHVDGRGPAFCAYIVACCTFAADGTRAFDDDDRTWLAEEKADAPVMRIFRAIDDINIFTDVAEQEAKKNSGQTGS